MLTPGGRGAVATIRIEGDLSALESAVSPLFLASKGRPVSLLEVDAIHFGRWENEHGEGIVATRHSEHGKEGSGSCRLFMKNVATIRDAANGL